MIDIFQIFLLRLNYIFINGIFLRIFLILNIINFNCENSEQEFQLSENTYKMWKEFIKPTNEELAWTQIPWRNTFYEGLIDSDRLQKPLLLWVMNGHPMGCT